MIHSQNQKWKPSIFLESRVHKCRVHQWFSKTVLLHIVGLQSMPAQSCSNGGTLKAKYPSICSLCFSRTPDCSVRSCAFLLTFWWDVAMQNVSVLTIWAAGIHLCQNGMEITYMSVSGMSGEESQELQSAGSRTKLICNCIVMRNIEAMLKKITLQSFLYETEILAHISTI